MAALPPHRGPYRLLRPPHRRSRVTIQVTCAALGAALGLVVPLTDVGPAMPVGTASQAMLALGFGTISLIAIVFTLLFTIVQWVLGTFSLRLRLFESQSFVWWMLGLCVGVFVYSVVATMSIQGQPDVAMAVPGLTLLGTIVTIFLLLRLQMLAFEAVQLPATVRKLTAEGRDVVAAVFPDPSRHPAEQLPPDLAGLRPLTWQGDLLVLQQIDGQALVDLAARHDTTIVLPVPIGGTIQPGAVLARAGAGVPDAALLQCLALGTERTMTQDPGFPLRLLADIALRAMSPAINDPATATQAMDGIENLLVELAGRDLAVGRLTDQDGTLRVELAVPTWEGILAETLDDLVARSRDSPLARRRLAGLLDAVAEACPDLRRRQLVHDRSAALGEP